MVSSFNQEKISYACAKKVNHSEKNPDIKDILCFLRFGFGNYMFLFKKTGWWCEIIWFIAYLPFTLNHSRG